MARPKKKESNTSVLEETPKQKKGKKVSAKKEKSKAELTPKKGNTVHGFTIASQDARDKAFAKISEKYGVQAHTITEADKEWEDRLWVSTGSLKLDYVIRQHFPINEKGEYEPAGVKLGHIMEAYGKDGAGKNVILHTLQKSLMRKSFAVDFCDVENKWDHTWAKVLLEETYFKLGLIPAQGGAEMILAAIKELFENRLTQCVGVDSSTALIPIKETEKEIEDDKQKAKVAARASLMARIIPQYVPLIKDMDKNYAAILFFLSQMSVSNMSGKGNPYNSTASSALRHACALRIMLAKDNEQHLTSNYNPKTKVDTDGGNKIGNYHRALIVKNNFGADGMAINIPVLRATGIDNDLELMELALDADVINLHKEGHMFNGELIAKHRGKVFEKIKEDKQLRDALRNETFKVYNQAYADKNFSMLEKLTDDEKRIVEAVKEDAMRPVSEEE